MDFYGTCQVQTLTACTDIICRRFSDSSPSASLESIVVLVRAVVLTAELPVSFIGAILNFVFVCRNKPNFLVRVYAYTCIPVTLILAAFWLNNLPVLWKMSYGFWFQPCVALHLLLTGLLPVLLWIIAVLSCTISINLLQKLCNTYCSCCSRCTQPSCWRNTRVRVCLEILFILLAIVVPLLIFAAIYGTELYVTNSLSFSERIYYIHVFYRISYSSFCVGFVMVVPLALSFISDIVLIVWFCKVRRQIARRATMYKELVLFAIHLLVNVLATLLFIFFYLAYLVPPQLIPDGNEFAATIVLTLLTLFPFCVHVYMICSFCTPGRENRPARIYNLQTAGLQTVPPSTRVSLPTDTAAHAPNFLSPSTAEPTDVTPLLN